MCTAYHDEHGALVTDRRSIVSHYCRGWFLSDLIASLPLDWFLMGIPFSDPNLDGSGGARHATCPPLACGLLQASWGTPMLSLPPASSRRPCIARESAKNLCAHVALVDLCAARDGAQTAAVAAVAATTATTRTWAMEAPTTTLTRCTFCASSRLSNSSGCCASRASHGAPARRATRVPLLRGHSTCVERGSRTARACTCMHVLRAAAHTTRSSARTHMHPQCTRPATLPFSLLPRPTPRRSHAHAGTPTAASRRCRGACKSGSSSTSTRTPRG